MPSDRAQENEERRGKREREGESEREGSACFLKRLVAFGGENSVRSSAPEIMQRKKCKFQAFEMEVFLW
jgi:hypothetical protein